MLHSSASNAIAARVSEHDLRSCIVELLDEREDGKTICPSEVARKLAEAASPSHTTAAQDWRGLMVPVRAAAATLVAEGLVEVVQGGAVVDVRIARGPVRLRRGATWAAQARRATVAPRAHWLLPIDPSAHPEYLPDDWRVRADATAVWHAVARSQLIDKWCLATGFRLMRGGDTIWAYLSKRQEVCAVGTVRSVVREADDWFVLVDWHPDQTIALCRTPVPRRSFGQVPMSVCRASQVTQEALLTAVSSLEERSQMPVGT